MDLFISGIEGLNRFLHKLYIIKLQIFSCFLHVWVCLFLIQVMKTFEDIWYMWIFLIQTFKHRYNPTLSQSRWGWQPVSGVFRKAGVGNRWMWPSLDVTLVLLGSHPVLMRTRAGHEVASSAWQSSSVSYRYDSCFRRCIFGDGDLLEWLLGLIFLFFKFYRLFFFFI